MRLHISAKQVTFTVTDAADRIVLRYGCDGYVLDTDPAALVATVMAALVTLQDADRAGFKQQASAALDKVRSL